MIQAEADRLGVTVSFFQSNHEGALVDAIQQAYFDHVDGIIINPGGLHPHQRGPAGRGEGRGHPHGGGPRVRPRQPGGLPPRVLHPGGLRGHHPGPRPAGVCGGPAAPLRRRTLDKPRPLADNVPIPHWVSGRCRYETMYGRGQPAPAAEEDHRPGAGHRPHGGRGRALRGRAQPRSTPPSPPSTSAGRWCWRGTSSTASGTASSTATRTRPSRASPRRWSGSPTWDKKKRRLRRLFFS